ncbi:hypothetical protein V9T40_004733 [Parthenolecanium corni]|uniref:Arginine/serine-rich protein PNISR n=1 Tax=Parthenolecanium corni TaxID=536013 RepID=A0AAN9Y3D5_9HEMI
MFVAKELRQVNTMFPSGQWSFNPLAYQNVPSDRVDWASLAQQWIKMKETLPNLNQEPTPPPAPLISKPKNSRSESVAEPLPNDIEGGEAPMDMDTKDDDIPESVGASSSWNQWNNWPNQWGWGWSGNAGTVPSADNVSSTSSSVDSKVKWNENSFPADTVKSTSETWSRGNRPRQSQKPVVEQTSVIDAVKKKQLPAWIREGLNKMEREKQKKLERERLMQERQMRKQEPFKENSPEENLRIAANNPTHVPSEPFKTATTIPRVVHPFESTAIDVPDPPRLSSPPINKEENTSLIRKTKDEIMEESMLKIRRILTEILLEATENHVVMIAREELKRAKSSARAVRRSNAVSSVKGNLGLNIYGSGSDDSDSSSSENTYFDRKSDSDEELKSLIDRKKQDFRKIEDEIEIQIEKQEAKEKLIARQEEDDDDDDDGEDSDVDNTKSNSGSVNRLQEVPQQDVRSKSSSSKDEDDSATSSNKPKEQRVSNQQQSGSGNDGNRSTSQINGDRKNGKVELKHTRSPSSSSSSSDSKSESSSSKSSRSKSSYSSGSGSDSDTSSHRKRSKHKAKTNERSKRPAKTKRYRSRSRSPSRDRRSTDSRTYSSRSYKSESYGRRSSPYRRRSRSRQRSTSRGREKYSESSRRYDSHSKPRRRRSNSSDSRRSRYKRR